MKLVVGLGNPGIKYAMTRHNVGFFVIDRLSEQWQMPTKTHHKWNAEIAEGRIRGEKVVLFKPQTYMNRSGEAVRPVVEYFNIDLDDIVVIYDDLDLPPGKIRLRLKGSAGGHNGMRSVIHHVGSETFKRIRVGIGRPVPPMSVTDYVLTSFAKEEEADVAEAVDRAVASVNCWIDSGFLAAMNRYNGI